MIPVLFRSARRITVADIQALAEYLRSGAPIERGLHRLLESHPALIGVLGFHEFVSEFPINTREYGGPPAIDPRNYNRADIVAARLDVSSSLAAKKWANLVELKGADARVLDGRTQRRSSFLNSAVNQIREYSKCLTEASNRELLAKFGWDVWQPTKIVIMGIRSEFAYPGQFENLRQELLDTDGVRIVLTDDLLALAEMERHRTDSSTADLLPTEGLLDLDLTTGFLAPLIVASGGLGGLILARRRVDDALNSYGNVDIRETIPEGLVHIDKLRLQPLARKLGVPYAQALVGFNKVRRDGANMLFPQKSGIVVAEFDAHAIESAFQQRESRNLPRREKARALRSKSQVRRTDRVDAFAAGVTKMFPTLSEVIAKRIAKRAIKRGRVGSDPSLRLEEAVWLAVAAYAAYEKLRLPSKEVADKQRDEVCALLRSWGGPQPDTILRATLSADRARKKGRK